MRTTLTLFTFLTTYIAIAQSYQSIEATEYDATQNRWLTTNGSSIIAQDADGNLSFFGSGNANYGMEAMNGTLFAIYNSAIKGYDLLDGSEVMSISIPGAGFLNGMGSDPATNRLWVSDFSNSRIIELDVSDLSSPTQQIVVNNTGSTPNGVVYDHLDNRVVFVSWGNNAAIKAIDLSDYTVTTLLSSGLGNIDGIDMTEGGDFFVSSWSPTRITQYNHDFSESDILASSGLSNPADISWAEEINTLGVANSGNNTLSLISYSPSSTDELSISRFDLDLFPNPVSTASSISFTLDNSGLVEINVRDIQGRLVMTIMREERNAGEHRVMLDGLALEQGQYVIEMQVQGTSASRPFVVMR